MSMIRRFVSSLGQQTAPFGFAPDDPNAAYKAGLGYIGDVGANLLANNQGGVNPWANLGASLQQAKSDSTQRNKEQYTAQRLMEEAAIKKQEREQAEAERKRREDYINTLPPDVRMKAMSIPGYLDSWIAANDPSLQKPDKPQFMEVNGKIVNPATGQVVFDGGGMASDAPDVKTIYDPETGQELVVQWTGDGPYDGWTPLGGPKARGGSNNIGDQVEERKAAAEAMGLTPEDPAYKAYVLTGKMPREDQAPLTATDKKAILDADEAVLANTTVIDQLKSVLAKGPDGKSINDRAGSGSLAGVQSWLARNDGIGIFDDTKGQATTQLQNIVLNQALSSLKSIFGAAPTEGERQILIDLQASIDKTPDERRDIIERAVKAAEKRLEFNKQRADNLRGGSYYKPGGGNAPLTTEDGYTIEPVE